MTPSDQQSAERRAPDQEPTYSLTELCRSWAEVTGEAWQSILYRFGDWTITDAFPDDAFFVDTFLPANRGDTTFHKKIIFDRVQWHRDLVDKIRRVQDPNEKARLQRFADIHMKTLETAVMRRDVLMEACRAMKVAPPPILSLVEGVSAEYRVPPECPLHPPVEVFAREAERDQKLLRHRDVMPADEATLLWDAAAEMSRNNGRSRDRNWLHLMDAFWRGELSPDGPLVYFYPGLPGREHVKLDRMALAGSLLGHRDLDAAAAKIETLREWAVADYLGQPAPFDFFRENAEGRFGLAVLTRDLDQWHQRPAELISDAGPIAHGSDAAAAVEAAANAILPNGQVVTEGLQPLLGKALQHRLEDWVRVTWGDDVGKLPGREELLRLAHAKPEFIKATNRHMQRAAQQIRDRREQKGRCRATPPPVTWTTFQLSRLCPRRSPR